MEFQPYRHDERVFPSPDGREVESEEVERTQAIRRRIDQELDDATDRYGLDQGQGVQKAC